jgi:hypothetical protein
MDKNIVNILLADMKVSGNKNKDSNPQINSDSDSNSNSNSDINKQRISLIMWAIISCLGYYIYMIWNKL